MRIQWSSSAAQETLSRLKKADQGLDSCLRQSALVRTALEEANKDGENQVLNKASARFESCVQKLQTLRQELEAFEKAVRKSDEQFEQANDQIMSLYEDLEQGSAPPVFVSGSKYQINWKPTAFSVMPDMRVHVTPVPSWLADAAAGMEEA